MDIDADVLGSLSEGDISVVGALPGSSNGALLVDIANGSTTVSAVYKPEALERPLHDFPDGTLSKRELAAYLFDAILRWSIVPPTVWRQDGPLGPGIVQQFVPGTPDGIIASFPEQVPNGWCPVLSAVDEDERPVLIAHRDTPRLRQIALFDVAINNADRKVGHLISTDHGEAQISGVDHGLTFNVDPKLRTILWGFAGQQIGEAELAQLRHFCAEPPPQALAAILDPQEMDQLYARVDFLVGTGRYPQPPRDRYPIPWPIV